MQPKTPIIAIVGRPNVGKSSLFNRLIGKRHAIISKIAGTTRDRIYYRTSMGHYDITLVDTGGLEYKAEENIETNIQAQVELAIADADLIFFVVDAKEGLTIEDHEATKRLRKVSKKVLLVANKSDVKDSTDMLHEFLRLGFGEPIAISAYHNNNVDELIETTEKTLKEMGMQPPPPASETKEKKIKISFIGRPNAGKSSLVNALLGKEKVIVDEVPGTTRDATDTDFTFNDQEFTLIDTAGLRRRGKIERGLEKLSSFRSIEAVERCDIACLVLDYGAGIRKQDQHIAAYAQDAAKGIILIVNKADLMDEKETALGHSKEDQQNRMLRILRARYDFLPWAPVIFTSALTKKNIEKILELAAQIYDERFMRIPDDELQLFMKEITYKHLPPRQSNRLPKFYALAQTGVNPPAFNYVVSNPEYVHFSYRRYLENELRKKYGFTGTTIRIFYKEKKRRKRRDDKKEEN